MISRSSSTNPRLTSFLEAINEAICPLASLSMTAVAVSAQSVSPTSPATSGLDYGRLGSVGKEDFQGFINIDPKFMTRTPEKTLALFRYKQSHPLTGGTFNHPVTSDEILENKEYVRALFYRAAQRAPQLITSNDWRLVRADERDVMESICETLGEPGTAPAYNLTEKDCAALKAH